MRQRIEREIYSLVFIEGGGMLTNGGMETYSEARRANSESYQLVSRVTDRLLRTIRSPSEAVVAAMANVVLSDGDIRQEWQAGVDAAGKP